MQKMAGNQVLNDVLRALFAEEAILRRLAGGVRKAHDFNQPAVKGAFPPIAR